MPSKFSNYRDPKAPVLKQFPVKGSLADRLKNKVIDKVSDVMSYPARRAAQKSMINADRNFGILRNRSDADKKNFKWAIEKDGELIASPRVKQMKALEATTKPKTQRDVYATAMNSAMKKGGSNGVGVGR